MFWYIILLLVVVPFLVVPNLPIKLLIGIHAEHVLGTRLLLAEDLLYKCVQSCAPLMLGHPCKAG